MIFYFEIVNVLDHHNRGQFIFARIKSNEEILDVKEGSLFGGIPIYHYLDMQKLLGAKENEPRVFCFCPLIKRFPNDYFSIGQIVTLEMLD